MLIRGEFSYEIDNTADSSLNVLAENVLKKKSDKVEKSGEKVIKLMFANLTDYYTFTQALKYLQIKQGV